MGGFAYPKGMAGTKRIQHAIDALKEVRDVSMRVIVLTQSSRNNVLNGTYLGIEYQTVMGDLFRMKMVLLYPLFILKTIHVLKISYCSASVNVIYHYGPPNLLNIGILWFANRLGYKIVFDIVEDDDTAMRNSLSPYHFLKTISARYLKRYINKLASGIIVISSHLHRKFFILDHNQCRIHYRPISVDFSVFTSDFCYSEKNVTLFYAGSFGKKDGLPVLLDAFDQVASLHTNIQFVLTGIGNQEMMSTTLARIDASPFKNRIIYKGYLNDDAYYAELSNADILCMTRINSPYAHAGFPFKLGEFLATGKPVIASRISDVPHMFRDQNELLLVEPGDSKAIAQAISYLLTHPLKAIEIGRRGKTVARSLFDHKTQGKALLTFLHNL